MKKSCFSPRSVQGGHGQDELDTDNYHTGHLVIQSVPVHARSHRIVLPQRSCWILSNGQGVYMSMSTVWPYTVVWSWLLVIVIRYLYSAPKSCVWPGHGYDYTIHVAVVAIYAQRRLMAIYLIAHMTQPDLWAKERGLWSRHFLWQSNFDDFTYYRTL